jgi:hypothetical protein
MNAQNRTEKNQNKLRDSTLNARFNIFDLPLTPALRLLIAGVSDIFLLGPCPASGSTVRCLSKCHASLGFGGLPKLALRVARLTRYALRVLFTCANS